MKAVTEEELNQKICPYIRGMFGNKPCIRERCLSFKLQEDVEWDETRLGPVGDPANQEIRDAELTTGRLLKANIGSCALGVFSRVLLNIRVAFDGASPGEMRTERTVETTGPKNGETS